MHALPQIPIWKSSTLSAVKIGRISAHDRNANVDIEAITSSNEVDKVEKESDHPWLCLLALQYLNISCLW